MKKYTTSQRLKEIMQKKGIKQIDILNKIKPICEKWGVKMGSNDLSQYVTGKVEPSQKKLSVLAEVLGTNEVWLMGYDVPMNKELSVDDFSHTTEQFSPDLINEEIYGKYNNLTYLSVKTGIPSDELKKIMTGENKLPKPKYLKKIADVLEEDVNDYFIGYGYIEDSDTDNDLFTSGIRFLLSNEDRHDLCSILKNDWKPLYNDVSEKDIYYNLFGKEKEEFSSTDLISILKNDNNIRIDNATSVDIEDNTVKIPVLGTIKAGIPIEAQEDILEYIEIPKTWLKGGKNFYGLKISGDSMFPKYLENDIVVFEDSRNYDIWSANNKDCAVMVNGYDATFKKVKLTNEGITLMPYNTAGYDFMIYSNEDIEKKPIKIIGIAREKRTKV